MDIKDIDNELTKTNQTYMEFIPKCMVIELLKQFKESASKGCTGTLETVVFQSIVDYINNIEKGINLIPATNVQLKK